MLSLIYDICFLISQMGCLDYYSTWGLLLLELFALLDIVAGSGSLLSHCLDCFQTFSGNAVQSPR